MKKQDVSKQEMCSNVARWIYHDCDTPIEEIIYILEKAYPKLKDLESEYDAVLEFYNSHKLNEEEN
tara:strand:+ start:557 stop:754 length:198 start_codon:yes stop_codon:yes gene_type:complete